MLQIVSECLSNNVDTCSNINFIFQRTHVWVSEWQRWHIFTYNFYFSAYPCPYQQMPGDPHNFGMIRNGTLEQVGTCGRHFTFNDSDTECTCAGEMEISKCIYIKIEKICSNAFSIEDPTLLNSLRLAIWTSTSIIHSSITVSAAVGWRTISQLQSVLLHIAPPSLILGKQC